MRVAVDVDRCIGAGQCALIAPDTFDQDDDGLVILLREGVTEPSAVESAREAANVCPARVITVDAG